MPLDAICMQAVVRETAAQIENTRIEKIQQPARDQVIPVSYTHLTLPTT